MSKTNKTSIVRTLMTDHCIIKTETNYLYGCDCFQAGWDAHVRILKALEIIIEEQRQLLEETHED